MIGNAVKAMHIATAQPEDPKHQATEGALRKGAAVTLHLIRVFFTFRARGRRHGQPNLQIKHETPAERSRGSRRPNGKLT
jgi:hypothetical protein